MRLLEEAKMLYNQHREYISYDELRAKGYTVLETVEIIKYLTLLCISGIYHKYLVRVFYEESEVYNCYIIDTNLPRAKSIVETRCDMYDISYTDIKIDKIEDYEV